MSRDQLKKYTYEMSAASAEDFYELSMRSARAKSGEVCIFEISSLNDVIDRTRAEAVRSEFYRQGTKVFELTNSSTVKSFTQQTDFINDQMLFRRIPRSTFAIDNEVLIFDTTVAIYNTHDLLIIEDATIAKSWRQLFFGLWQQADIPRMDFNYEPKASYYNSFDICVGERQIIVWPDLDAVEVYQGMSAKDFERLYTNILDDAYYEDTLYVVSFLWSDGKRAMLDIWKYSSNSVDDRSGPLGDVRVYANGVLQKEGAVASGSTLLALGYEEQARRMSESLRAYISGPRPMLPMELCNGEDFLEAIRK